MSLREKILIVDDEPHNVQILRIFLNSLNYSIHTAECGSEALRLYDEIRPDLILLDVMMPDMSGFDVCKQWMSREEFDTPVIFLSANVQKKDILQGLQLGAFDYLTKPYDLDLLEMKVSYALGQKQKLERLMSDKEKLSERANTDALTGLYNRMYLNEVLLESSVSLADYGAMLMIDMDNFKYINDTFGHLVGDQVLQAIASIIQKAISPENDLAFRFGGDEFLVLLQQEQGAMETAQEIIRAVNELAIGSLVEQSAKASVSIGITKSSDHYSFEQIIGFADRALLRSKQSGKNQITIY
ncbi:GGDEF domain-containing response regulator [Paenibacillus glycanilyticus]|uniref:Diguanylate cyclase response regulator n=1 Tax=Paenibacillus glycanilyticus TaxID=126569 RepID=A0ABQ6NSW7_9BACL|nr:diguanylate cyclase [Paenibacillus glycanilyticus]GMK48161.1 diguanylate cyclase response regulator [Paenibacillus glycanilyticus]